jgi:hypothetical protein
MIQAKPSLSAAAKYKRLADPPLQEPLRCKIKRVSTPAASASGVKREKCDGDEESGAVRRRPTPAPSNKFGNAGPPLWHAVIEEAEARMEMGGLEEDAESKAPASQVHAASARKFCAQRMYAPFPQKMAVTTAIVGS